jgi:hypothetical protein
MPTPLIGPDGREYEIDDSDPAALDNALKQGFRVETAEAPRTLSEKASGLSAEATEVVNAGLFGAGQGATAGLYGASALSKSEGDSPEEVARKRTVANEAQRLAEAHPVASTVGNIAGMVVSPLSKVSGAVAGSVGATTAAGRIGAGLLGGAAEGSLFGAGNAISDSVLGDHQLTGEQLVAGAGLGAVLGGVGGGLGTGLGEAASAGARGLKKLSGKLDLGEFAKNRWFKAADASKGEIGKVPETEREAVADVFRRHISPQDATLPRGLDEALESLRGERDNISDAVMKRAGLDDVPLKHGMDPDEARTLFQKAASKREKIQSEVYEGANKKGIEPDYQGFATRFDEFKGTLNPVERDLIKDEVTRVQGYLDDMAVTADPAARGYGAINKIKSTLTRDINYNADGGAKVELKKRLYGVLRDEADTQLAPRLGSDEAKRLFDARDALGTLAEAEKALARKTATGSDAIEALIAKTKLAGAEVDSLRALNHGERILKHGAEKAATASDVSMRDIAAAIAGSVATGGTGLGGIPMALASKLLRSKGDAVIARLADKLTKSPALSTVAQSFAQKAAQATPYLGEYAATLAQAAAKSPQHALATHLVMAQADPAYGDAASMAGFIPQSEAEQGAAVQRAHGIATIAANVAAQNEEIDRAVARAFKGGASPKDAALVLKGQDFGAKRMRRDGEAAHNRRADEIQALATNPEAMLDRLTANMGDLHTVAPGVAAAITQTADRAVKYLSQAAQRPAKTAPLAKEWKPTEAERHAFAQKLEVVENPMVVLSHAAAGTLTKAQVEALNAVYPSLGRQIADKVLERLTENPKSVPYSQRVMLAMLTKTDVDGTLSPKAIAANQAAIQRSKQAGEPAADAPQATAGKKAEKLSLASRTATASQAREVRE